MRYIPSACKDLIKEDFNKSGHPITDAQTGIISFSLFHFYSFLSNFNPIFFDAEKLNNCLEYSLYLNWLGYQMLMFLLFYIIFAPIFGTLADKGVSRKWLLFIGITGWSIAAGSAAFSINFESFLVSRYLSWYSPHHFNVMIEIN